MEKGDFVQSKKWILLTGIFLLVSCRDAEPDLPGSRGSSTTPDTEESPNAHILPDPLGEEIASKKSDNFSAREEPVLPPVARGPAQPWPLRGALPEDLLTQQSSTGYRAVLNISWSSAQRSAKLLNEDVLLWPSFDLEFLAETEERAARLRLISRGRASPFPPGTELRLRADRLGFVLVWPDDRSYRVVPPGALRSLFVDRRVDRVPFVEAKVKISPEKESVEPTARIVQISTSIGQARLETTALKDLPFAAPLLCRTLLEFVRVKNSEQLCPLGQIPLHFEFVWLNGNKLTADLSELKPATDLATDRFRSPPSLPILKTGELPPFSSYLLSETERFAHLPLSKTKEPIPPTTVVAPTTSNLAPTAPVLPPQPANEIELHNNMDRPLFIVMNRLPLLWLDSGETLAFYTKPGDVRISARDFVGEQLIPEQVVTSPTRLYFGKKAVESSPTD